MKFHGSGGNKKWIVISIAISIVVTFALGVTILRQTHAIWDMETQNAVTVNSTLNTVYGLEPLIAMIVIVGLVLLWMSTRLGFAE